MRDLFHVTYSHLKRGNTEMLFSATLRKFYKPCFAVNCWNEEVQITNKSHMKQTNSK